MPTLALQLIAENKKTKATRLDLGSLAKDWLTDKEDEAWQNL